MFWNKLVLVCQIFDRDFIILYYPCSLETEENTETNHQKLLRVKGRFLHYLDKHDGIIGLFRALVTTTLL